MKEVLISILVLTGSFFILVAALGLVRLQDLYSRMHATTKATSFGILLMISGVILFFSTWVVLLKGLLVLLFIYLTAPLAAHSIAHSFTDQDEPADDTDSPVKP